MFNKKSYGALWVMEKVKQSKTGKQIKTRFLRIKIALGNHNLYFVAFASGKKPESSENYPDFLIYPSGENTEKLLKEANDYLNQIFGAYIKNDNNDNLKIVKADEIEGEPYAENDFYDV